MGKYKTTIKKIDKIEYEIDANSMIEAMELLYKKFSEDYPNQEYGSFDMLCPNGKFFRNCEPSYYYTYDMINS